MIAFGRADYKSSSMPVHRGHFHSFPESLYSMWAAPLGSGVYTPQLQSFPVATVKYFETIDLHAFSRKLRFLLDRVNEGFRKKVSHPMADFSSTGHGAALNWRGASANISTRLHST